MLSELLSEIDVLMVRKSSKQSYQEFHVRIIVMHEALTWLLEKNKYYGAKAVHLNENALAQLPHETDIRSLHLGGTASGQRFNIRPTSLPH